VSQKIIVKKPSDIEVGLYEASAQPKGNYRSVWIMKLRRKNEKCKLPRGFGFLSGKAV